MDRQVDSRRVRGTTARMAASTAAFRPGRARNSPMIVSSIELLPEALDVPASPAAHLLDDGHQRTPVVRERVDDGPGHRAVRLADHDLVRDQLAQLLGEHFLRNGWHELPESREVPG